MFKKYRKLLVVFIVLIFVSLFSCANNIDTTYKVIFFDDNFVALKEIEILKEEINSVESLYEAPKKEGLVFVEWIINIDEERNTVTLKGVWEPIKYKVLFKDYDGNLLKEEFVKHNKSATAPINVVREGHRFLGWDKDFSNITKDLEVYAQYEILKFKVKWVNFDGTILYADNEVEWGKLPVYKGPTPFKASEEDASYVFVGWDKDYSEVKEDDTYTALFEKQIKTFQVLFLDHNGNILKEDIVYYGNDAEAPLDLEIEGYEFISWNKEFNNITEDLVVNGLFKIKTYTVIWKNYNGDIVHVDYDVKHGTVPSFTNYLLLYKHSEEEKYFYEFISWDKPLNAIKEDTEFIAVYEKMVWEFSVIFYDADDNEIKFEYVKYGESAKAPEAPEHDEFEFSHWDQDFSEVTSDLYIRPVYRDEIYEITWKNYDGSILEVNELNYNKEPVYNGPVPTKDINEHLVYTFVGWDQELTNVISDKIYTAIYETDYPSHYVMAKDSDFIGFNDGGFTYVGNESYVIIPTYINGIKLTKTAGMNHDKENNRSYFVRLFENNLNIKGVIFEGEDNIVDMSYLFNKNQTKELELKYLNTHNVKVMREMFSEYNGENLDLSSFDTTKVENMDTMFYKSKIKNLDLSSFNTSNVTDMSWIFYDTEIENLTFGSFSNDLIISMESMFQGSIIKNLINFNNFKTANVKNMDYMFYRFKTDSLDLSDFDTSNVVSMKNMFFKLEVNTLLGFNNFNTNNVENMEYMFYGINVDYLDLSNFQTHKVTTMDSMFYEAELDFIDVSSFDTSNVIHMRDMFAKINVDYLDLSNFDTSNVESMNSMFSNANIRFLDVSSFNTSKVEDMDYMFYAAKINYLDLSNFNTRNVITMKNMFYRVETSILDISSFTHESVENKSDSFKEIKANKVYVKDESERDFFNIGIVKGKIRVEDESGAFWFYVDSNELPKALPDYIDNRNIYNEKYLSYDIEGWYTDPLFKNRIDEIPIGTEENLKLYINFELRWTYADPVEDFDIIYVNNSPYIWYTGSGKHVIIPEYVQATFAEPLKLTNISYLFIETDVSSFKILNEEGEDVSTNIVEARGLFALTTAKEIDLSYFNSENVIDLSEFFYNAKATSVIGLETLNTSSVLNMALMFHGTKFKELDLSNFDTSNVYSFYGMFHNSRATSIIGLENFNTSNALSMQNMFSYSDIKFLDLSSFDTSNVSDMSGMFALSNVVEILGLETFITSKVDDMRDMFYRTKLLTIDVSSFDTSNVVDMLGMFSFTDATSIIGLNNFNTSKVKTMKEMFYNAKTIVLDVSSFDTSKVTDVTRMFLGISADEIIGIENFDTSTVFDFGQMFQNVKLNSLDISNFDTSKAVNMTYMFQGAEIDNLIGLENFDTSNVTDMSYMFSEFVGSTLDLSSFDTSKVTDMYRMFEKAVVVNLDLSSFDVSNVANIEEMFKGIRISELTLLNFEFKKYTTIKKLFAEAEIEVLDITNFNTSETNDFSYMFYEAKIGEIIGLEFLDTSNASDMSYMFYELEVMSLDISNFNTSNVKDMSYMFYRLNVDTIDLSNFNTENVKDMSFMFRAVKVSVLDLSSFNTSNVINMESMFDLAGEIEIIGLDVFDTSKVTKMERMVFGVSTEVLDLSSFDTSNVVKMDDMLGFTRFSKGYARNITEANKLNSYAGRDVFLVKED